DFLSTYTNTSIERHQNTHELWIAAIPRMSFEWACLAGLSCLVALTLGVTIAAIHYISFSLDVTSAVLATCLHPNAIIAAVIPDRCV
ncbi:MAG: hypothetical protein J4F28_00005, partial [Nitrosopumilaceae archaeon]|nr:hypothetical protein [Nitrosopumilaceae archaeon]